MSYRRWIVSMALTVAALASAATAFAANLQHPATVADDPALLLKNKSQYAAGAGPRQAISDLLGDADDILGEEPRSVMDKNVAGPGGDKHDYVSYAPYFWPDPKDPKAPFIRKDGYRNSKQVAQGDAPAYEKLNGQLHTLGLAYFYSNNEKYAKQAALMARTWFLDPDTRMNPNFQHAQAVIGTNDGRGTGLIENRGLVGALDGLTLLRGSQSWTDADDQAMHEWVAKFDIWLTTSAEGLAEKAAPNNHGSWYAYQEAGLYLYLNQPDQAKKVFEAVEARIAKQIEPDGRQPMEIARQDGFSYSTFNLSALTTIATLAQRQNIDLWHYHDGTRSIKAALDFLLPFAEGQKKWPTTQLKKISADSLLSITYAAWQIYHDPAYRPYLEAHKQQLLNSGSLLSGEE